MKYLRMGGLAAFGVLACSMASAQDIQIDLSSHGLYSIGSGSFSVNEVVIYQSTTLPMPTLTSMTYTASTSGPPYAGDGTYTNGVDSFTFHFELTGDVPTDGFSSTQTAHGLWTYTSGTGAFANYSGSGVIASNYNAPAGATSLTVFSGRLVNLVPEPATVAALGIGAAALLRRRRK